MTAQDNHNTDRSEDFSAITTHHAASNTHDVRQVSVVFVPIRFQR